ncbi:MAG TPA: hypothetical protein VK453_08195 [Micromonosporaceae bacterium]|nr:hypothetical protein [Micromonosporaceae bacterium]
MAPTIFLFGRDSDDLLVAKNAAAALDHVLRHAGTGHTVDDFEFFDAAGQPLAPVPGALGELRPLDPQEYLERRVRLLLDRAWAEALPAERARYADLVGAFLAGTIDFATLTAGMARVSRPRDSKHSRGGLHSLCHRVHLC